MSGNVNNRVSPTISEILQGVGKLQIDGVDVGSFQGGVRLTWNQTEMWVESEHTLGYVDSEISQVRYTVETELEQATLENLAIAWGLHSSSVVSGTSSKTLDLVPVDVMREVGITFEGMSATNRDLNRTFTAHKAVRVGSSQSTLNRGTKTTIPVTFECLLNSSGSFGTIVDATVE